jgi:DNA (cytosine-5)-methyltransferase 1
VPTAFGVVDLFAGPGGLGEGFSTLEINGFHPFRIGVSVEKEVSAHRTLTLRAFLREYRSKTGGLPREYIDFHAGRIAEPAWSSVDPTAWQTAEREALCLELGNQSSARVLNASIDRLRRSFDRTILIGGPPCQAYSLVGRARSRGKVDYVPAQDERHFLFREYIRVLDRLRPAAFVMENVRGMLSSTVDSRLVFEMLMEDLSSLGSRGRQLYDLMAIDVDDCRAKLVSPARPSDFVVKAELFGVPQRRHRVIIVGIRSDLPKTDVEIDVAPAKSTLMEAIGNLPKLRSGLSGKDEGPAWQKYVQSCARNLSVIHKCLKNAEMKVELDSLYSEFKAELPLPRSASRLPRRYGKSNDPLMKWLERPELEAIAQHESRSHMDSDLQRYLYAAVFASLYHRSPKASDFPLELAPKHKNWTSGIFADRFRVQLANEPSTTITSHISKDGHYFIHPDPAQCRSLTVREAARLQTFPDDYLFLGNRTQQYVQVGNAVPPFLARQIARLLYRRLGA